MKNETSAAVGVGTTTGKEVQQLTFEQVAQQNKLTTPQQVRDEAIFRLCRAIYLKMEPDEEERQGLYRIEKMFSLAQKKDSE